MIPKGLSMIVLSLFASCTSGTLVPHLEQEQTLPQNNKTFLEGEICTSEAGNTILPHWVLFIMDQSASLNEENDPTYSLPGYGRTSGRQEAAKAVVQALQDNPAFYFSFIYFNYETWRCPRLSPHFRQGDMDACLRELEDGESVTDIYASFVNAYDLLLTSLQELDPRTARRTQITIIFFGDGQPNVDGDLPPQINHPNEQTENILLRVGEVMSLTDPLMGGARRINIHTVFLQGQMSEDSSEYAHATDLLSQVAERGNGEFLAVEDAEDLDFLQFIQTEINSVKRFKSFQAFNPHVRLLPSGLVLDSDGDGLTDEEEVALGLNPYSRDTDGDGCGDLVEIVANFDPLVPDCPCTTGDVDSDGDLLTDCEELILGTDPESPDSDGDGIPDGIEVWFGTNPLVYDSHLDFDSDGRSNFQEIAFNTSPFHADGADRSRYEVKYDIFNRKITEDGRECFDFRVENISLGITLPSQDGSRELGMNDIHLFASEVPFDVPNDLGDWMRADFRARYMGPELKEPAEGFFLSEWDLERM